MTLVKICGTTNTYDASFAIKAGADIIGINFVKPNNNRESPRYTNPETAGLIVNELSSLRNHIKIAGVFVNENSENVERIIDTVGLDILQFHGDTAVETLKYCGKFANKGRKVWKAIRLKDRSSITEVKRYYESGSIDGILLDAYVPRQRGGTGQTIDRYLGLEATAVVKGKTFILAGGLNHLNVQEAIYDYRPSIVDVSSGVEEYKGKKSDQKVKYFIRYAKRPEFIISLNIGINRLFEHLKRLSSGDKSTIN